MMGFCMIWENYNFVLALARTGRRCSRPRLARTTMEEMLGASLLRRGSGVGEVVVEGELVDVEDGAGASGEVVAVFGGEKL